MLLAVLALASEAQAQRVVEWQVQGTAVATGEQFFGGGAAVALRAGRVRVGVAALGGAWEGAAALRGEAALSYHLNPAKRRGLTPYLGGGAAVTWTGFGSTEYLLVLVGVEWGPGGPAGWFVEAGAGGGLRLAAGVRWRHRLRRGR